jgi:hypothetical protein
MKTSEFIKLLHQEDPNDECEVAVGNCPVRFVDKAPYYYDGRLQHIVRDESGKVIKVGYKAGGMKLNINYDTIGEALMDYPDAELELSGITYKGRVDSHRMSYLEACIKEGKEYLAWRDAYRQARANGTPEPPITIRAEPEALQGKMMKWFKALGLVKRDIDE